MRWWICRNCNYIFEVETPPETCPECNAERVFSDITRYIDEFGGLDNLDMKLVVKLQRKRAIDNLFRNLF